MNFKRLFRCGLSLVFSFILLNNSSAQQARPKLAIGIVVDQMRNDYIERYWERFGEGGFKKLVQNGYRFYDAHYTYVPTYTAPGHATVYTGTTPAVHGIVANDWYDRLSGRQVYCAGDSTVRSVGAPPNQQGQMSPRNMLAATVGDELRNFFKDKSKVIGIALKDRGAILPAGHTANAAYWFDGDSGFWISSTYYMNDLPAWLKKYNDRKLPADFLSKPWNTLYPIETYTKSLPDENPWENPFKGKDKAVFPYDLKQLSTKNGGLNILRSSPWGNTLTADLAKQAIENEGLGADNDPDLLCVSFSSTDYVGHQFGPDAIETEDIYLRLDQDLADLLRFAEEKVGKENLVVFLTADHGGATTPSYLQSRKLNAGYLESKAMIDSAKAWLKEKYSATNWILNWNNDQIYLDEAAILAQTQQLDDVEQFLCRKLARLPGVRTAIASTEIRKFECLSQPASLVQKAWYAKRSGNIHIVQDPSRMEYSKKGTTHGSSYSYDTRVPVLWYGMQLNQGVSTERIAIEDIAPTLSFLLGIPMPNAASGKILPIPQQTK